MNIQLSKIAIYISYQSSHTDRLRVALIAAFLLHLLILILIPKIPEFRIPSASRDAALNVFLKTQDDVEKFEQVLNQPNDAENTENPITEPSRAAASADRGEDDLVTEESPVVESASADKLETESSGNDTNVSTPTRIITSWSALRRFTDQDVANYADTRPEELARFSRSFSSARSYRRRSKIQSYKDQYGDQYVRNSSSSGDICFKQERVQNPNELSTKTVYFFRCDNGPMKLDLKNKG